MRLSIKEQASDLHHSKKSLVNQREVRRDTQSFSQALRSMVSDSLQAAVTQTSSSLQMQTLDQCLNALVEEGLVTLEAAREEAVFSPKKI